MDISRGASEICYSDELAVRAKQRLGGPLVSLEGAAKQHIQDAGMSEATDIFGATLLEKQKKYPPRLGPQSASSPNHLFSESSFLLLAKPILTLPYPSL